MKYRNPWRDFAKLNGTDANTFCPNSKQDDSPWGFLDDLSRNGKFTFRNTQSYNGLTLYRYL